MTKRDPIEHDLKTWPEFYAEVVAGRKTFEVRVNDRDYRVGDTLRLREYAPEIGQYSGRETRQLVTYTMSGRFGIDPKYVIMGLRDALGETAPPAPDTDYDPSRDM